MMALRLFLVDAVRRVLRALREVASLVHNGLMDGLEFGLGLGLGLPLVLEDAVGGVLGAFREIAPLFHGTFRHVPCRRDGRGDGAESEDGGKNKKKTQNGRLR